MMATKPKIANTPTPTPTPPPPQAEPYSPLADKKLWFGLLITGCYVFGTLRGADSTAVIAALTTLSMGQAAIDYRYARNRAGGDHELDA